MAVHGPGAHGPFPCGHPFPRHWPAEYGKPVSGRHELPRLQEAGCLLAVGCLSCAAPTSGEVGLHGRLRQAHLQCNANQRALLGREVRHCVNGRTLPPRETDLRRRPRIGSTWVTASERATYQPAKPRERVIVSLNPAYPARPPANWKRKGSPVRGPRSSPRRLGPCGHGRSRTHPRPLPNRQRRTVGEWAPPEGVQNPGSFDSAGSHGGSATTETALRVNFGRCVSVPSRGCVACGCPLPHAAGGPPG